MFFNNRFGSWMGLAVLLLPCQIVLCLAQPARAQDAAKPPVGEAAPPRLHALFCDHMVLQQGVKAPVWGWAQPRERITVEMGKKSASTQADESGKWLATIGPVKAGGPYDLLVRGESSTTRIGDVMGGEVWLASGQSNMAIQVGPFDDYKGVYHAAEEAAAANYPEVRMFTVKKQTAGAPTDNVAGKWAVCSPETVRHFSATGYFFARELHKDLGVPVGVINASWGMMLVASFTSREALAADPESARSVEADRRKVAAFFTAVDDYVEAIREWQRTSAAMEAEGKSIPPPPAMPKDPRPSPFRITTIYNGMIAPLAPYALQGVIWYQGESNTIAPEDYRKAFRLLIKDWRRTWKRPDMPFLFVQLANRNVKPRGLITADSWPRLREAQLMTLSVPRTGMAVAIDVGDVVGEEYLIHPRNKQAVGRRLALAAEAIAYRRDVLYSGPIYRSMKVKDGKARLTFDHADGGLVAKDEKGELRSDGPLNTFTIAGADGKFVPAQARIEGKAVVVWADAVEKPKAVRYAFASNPVGCNLYNKAGLPASPFRSDGPASR